MRWAAQDPPVRPAGSAVVEEESMTPMILKSNPMSRRRWLSVVGLIAAVLFTGVVGAAGAQEPQAAAADLTLDEILQRHYEARGGLAAIQALDGIVIKGAFSLQGMEMPIVEYRQRPNLFRTETDFQGMQMVEAYDGKAAWGINPMMGSGKPERQGAEETRTLAMRADLDGPLVDWRRKGSKVELQGKETVDGHEAYKLVVTTKEGLKYTSWIDATTFLERKNLVPAMMQGQPMEIAISVTEWTDVAGTKQPAKVTLVTDMGSFDVVYSDIQVDAELDPEIFFLPGQKADSALTLEQVLERHIGARAKPGAESVQTLQASGKLGLMGLQLPLEMTFARPRLARLDADMAGSKLTLAFDGTTAWTVSPMQGMPEPEAMPPEAAEAIALFSDFLWGLLAEREAQGLEIELAGIEKVERDETYKLALKRSDGQKREVYLGGEDFLERKVHLQAVFMGTLQQLDALLTDYRVVGGLALPHSIQILSGGNPAASVTVEGVETNVAIADGFFSLPAKPATGAPPGSAP
jgi:outer membrane lipoprotein-sorting protein